MKLVSKFFNMEQKYIKINDAIEKVADVYVEDFDKTFRLSELGTANGFSGPSEIWEEIQSNIPTSREEFAHWSEQDLNEFIQYLKTISNCLKRIKSFNSNAGRKKKHN